MDSRFHTVTQLSRATRLPAAWIRREADAGRLPCLRVGRRRLFSLRAVLAAIAERQAREVHRDK
ncbi:MAG: hypothetical protein U0572_01090 [Phycisphaerales bacterium]